MCSDIASSLTSRTRRVAIAVVALCAMPSITMACEVGAGRLSPKTATANATGFVRAIDIHAVASVVDPVGDAETEAFNYIADGNDSDGSWSEYLWELVAYRTGCNYAPGPKYGGNKDNGVDFFVDDRTTYQKVIVYEVKQWSDFWGNASDGFQLSKSAAGYQLSDAWLRNAITQSTDASKATLDTALRLKTLRKAGSAVERNCGAFYCDTPQFLIFPVVVN